MGNNYYVLNTIHGMRPGEQKKKKKKLRQLNRQGSQLSGFEVCLAEQTRPSHANYFINLHLFSFLETAKEFCIIIPTPKFLNKSRITR